MEKKFKVPEHCKSFKVISLEDGDFEIIYEINQRIRTVGKNYYYLTDSLEIECDNDDEHYMDDARSESGNYFITKELAEEALLYIKNSFDEFWKTKNSSD